MLLQIRDPPSKYQTIAEAMEEAFKHPNIQPRIHHFWIDKDRKDRDVWFIKLYDAEKTGWKNIFFQGGTFLLCDWVGLGAIPPGSRALIKTPHVRALFAKEDDKKNYVFRV